jgi:hypothetical protein
LGILPALEITLAADDAQTKTASIDILTYIVEFSPSVVRDYTLQQTSNTDEVSSTYWLLAKVRKPFINFVSTEFE